MFKALALCVALGFPLLAQAGEKAFMTGDSTLIYKPFSLIKDILGEPTDIITDPARLTVRNPKPGTTLYLYKPVRLVSPLRTKEGLKSTRIYDCTVSVLVAPDQSIMTFGREGMDCDFSIRDYIR